MNRAVNKTGTSKSKSTATNKGSGTSTKRTKTKKKSPRPKESSQHQQQDETSNDSDQHFGLMSAEYHHELGTVYMAVSNHPLLYTLVNIIRMHIYPSYTCMCMVSRCKRES